MLRRYNSFVQRSAHEDIATMNHRIGFHKTLFVLRETISFHLCYMYALYLASYDSFVSRDNTMHRTFAM